MHFVDAAHAPAHAPIQPHRRPCSGVAERHAKPEPQAAVPAPFPAAGAADVPAADTHCRNPADNTDIAVAVDVAASAAIVAVVDIGNKGSTAVPMDHTPALNDHKPAPMPTDHTPEPETDHKAAKSSLDFDVADTTASVVDAVAPVPPVDALGTAVAAVLPRERTDPLILVSEWDEISKTKSGFCAGYILTSLRG